MFCIMTTDQIMKRSALIVFVFAFLIMDFLLPANATALIDLKEGDKPKGIILSDLNGNVIKVAAHFGKKPVIIVFWKLSTDESLINYSLDELLFLNDFYDRYHNKNGLEIFGIYTPEEESGISDAEISKVKKLILANKIKFPILLDKGLKYFKEYGIIALPSTVMVGKAGKIEFIYPSFPLSAGPVVSNQIREIVGVAAVEQKPEQVKSEGGDAKSHRLYKYALQMYKKGLLEQALSALNKFLALEENHSWAHNLKGVILWQRGNSPGAIDEFKRAIALDSNIASHLNYTILLFEQGRYKEAEKILVTSPASQAEYKVRAHYLLGLVYRDTNKIDKAVDELELANSLFEVWILSAKEDTHFFTFFFRIPMLRDLSDLYRKKGNDKKAIELLNRAVDLALGFEGKWETIPLNQRKGFMVYE